MFLSRIENGIHQDVFLGHKRWVKTRLKALKEFALDRSGASSIEYSIVAAGISVGMLAALNVAGTEVGATYQYIDDEYKKAVGN